MVVREPTERLEQPWDQGGVRAFLSHSSESKAKAAELRDSLQKLGITVFVAHEDIAPAREWQDVILKALDTMQMMILLLTPRFSESAWTNQEVGFALCRRVPIVSIRMGSDPAGFIGKYQSMSGVEKAILDIANDVFKMLLGNDDCHGVAVKAFITAVERSTSWDNSNRLAEFMPRIKELSSDQETALVQAFNENREVMYSFGFRRHLPAQLLRITGNDYKIIKNSDSTLTISNQD